MSNTIYYFTGTGNSLQIARDIAAGLGDTTLIPVNKALVESGKTIRAAGERVGIVFPVYAWGPPSIINRLAARLRVSPDAYVFSACNCAGSAGGTLPWLAKRLRKNGIRLESGFVLYMPTNYIKMSGAVSEEKQREYFQKESAKIDAILPAIREKQAVGIEKSVWMIRPLTALLYRISLPNLKRMDKAFFTDEKCNSCGICAKLCPADNITMEDGNPVWHRSCEQCLACLQWCPQEAIQINSKSSKRKRYRNPSVSLKDMLQ